MNKPLRLLFVIRIYAPDRVGGGAKSVQMLAEGLMQRGHDVHIARLVPRGGEAKARIDAEAAGLMVPNMPKIHFLPIRNRFWFDESKAHSALSKAIWHLRDLNNRAARRDFAALMREVSPDVVNTSIIAGFSTAIFAEAKAAGARLIHTMRDYYLVCARSGMYRNGRNCVSQCTECRIVAAVRGLHARDVDLFLANSAYVADTNARFGGVPPGKPTLVQWNVNERPPVATARALKDGEIVFGFIGRIAPSKGLENLIEAVLAQAAIEGRPWKLCIAGDGEPAYVAKLKARCADESRIQFLGWSASADFYSAIDVLCCPSTYNEPLPRVIYEGYGFALPTIAARTGGIPEIVEEGVSGLLYEGEDVAALTRCLLQFRTIDAEAYAGFSAAALDAARDFTPERVISTYEQRVEALISGGRIE